MSKQSKKGNKWFYCELCKKKKKENVVACDKCDKWFHFGCVNLTSIGKKEVWLCPNCKEDTSLKQPTGELQQNETGAAGQSRRSFENLSGHSNQLFVETSAASNRDPHQPFWSNPYDQLVSPAQSNKSFASSSSRKLRQLEMERIEEEHEMERRYLNKKYSFLFANYEKDSNASNASLVDVEPSGRSRNAKVEFQNPQRASIWECDADKQDFLRRLNDVRFENTSPLGFGNENRKLNVQSECFPSSQLNVGAQPFKSFRCHENRQDVSDQGNWKDLTTRFVVQSSEERPPNSSSCPKVNVGLDGLRVNQERAEPIVPKVTRLPIFPQPSSDKNAFEHSKMFVPKPNVSSPKQVGLPSKSSLPEDEIVLTKQQIASRQVVTKDLPSFSGKPEEWPMFYSRYINSTKLCGYTNGENLDRLQKCLKGNAYTAVGSRLLSSEPVSGIMTTLKTLYGRPELIVNALLEKLRQQPPPKADKLNTLVDFALAVKNVSATIERADLKSHLGNPILIRELVDRLPTSIKIDWAKYKANVGDVTIVTLGNWLYELAETISTITEPTVQSNSDNKKDQYAKKEFRLNVHQESSTTSSRQGGRKPDWNQHSQNDFSNSRQCVVCQKKCEHVEFCPKFISSNVDQRWTEVYKNGLCRKCLGRHNRFCATNKECGVNGCIFKHHRLLHDDKKHFTQNSSKNDTPKNNPAGSTNAVQTVSKSANVHNTFDKEVLLKIIPVTLHCKGQFLDTFAYLDDGSDATMMNKRIAEFFGLKGTPEPLCLLWTDDIHRNEKNSHRVFINISEHSSSPQYRLSGVRTVENLGLPLQTLIKSEIVAKFPYLANVPIEDYVNANAELLIGLDMASLLVPLESIEGELNQPIASRTRLGWTVHGPISSKTSSSVSVNPHSVICPYQSQKDEMMHQQMKEFFKIENFGVQVKHQTDLRSKDDKRALAILEKFTQSKGGRYVTSLLWRYDKFELPSSYGMARKRLLCLEKHKPELISAINGIINDYVAKGYARKLTEAEKLESNYKTWYLPLFIAFHPKKPERLRLVFDAAAKVKEISLNSMLLTGPDELTSMVDILRRFREKFVGIGADIKEMYHQVEVCDEDKNSQRFLWRNGDESIEPDEYILEVLPFGLSCSPSSAQFVKNKNADKFAERQPAAVFSIKKNHYVDDLLDCQHTTEEAVRLYNEICKIHRSGGFEMCKFISNSSEAMKLVGENDEANEKDLNSEIGSLGTDRVLGMYWNRQADAFTFSLKFTNVNEDILSGLRIPTKRELLKILMTIYDPLGLITHYLIHLKIILQDVWRAQINWDEPISNTEIISSWKLWLAILPTVERVQIPRVYSLKMTPNPPLSLEYHIFVDASEKAYSAVAYLRVEDETGVDCALIGSKSRVSPLKYLSIPRLELQAGVLGTRLLTSIAGSQTFKVNRRIIWTDSATVISWIRSDHRKFHQFVAHRIGEILDSTETSEWRYVPGKLNVADDATKWSKAPNFDLTNRWFSGPSFLKLAEENWPDQPQHLDETKEEMKVHFAHAKYRIPVLIDAERFSNWNRMVRAMAYVKRYVCILRSKVNREPVVRGHISRDELLWSRQFLFKQAQGECFPEEMVILARNELLPESQKVQIRRSSPIYILSPILDENGLMRLRGRLDAANVPYDMKRPIILPRNCRITRLLVLNCHQTFNHRNASTVVNELRQQFYIPSIRQVVKSVRSNDCQRCKNRDAKPQTPEMGSLPFGRLAVGFRVFTFVGIDYFGPVSVMVGRVPRKRWGVLFTCLTIRAIHIEIAHTLSTDSCMMCIRNFIDIRGAPREFFSDNGTNFRGADNELTKLIAGIDMEKLATHFTTFYTKWNFNPPESPHMGGSWERLVSSVKASMNEMITVRNPSDEMYRNLMMEAMNVVNSRPLTFIPIDNEDDEALTPNHFIHGNSNGIKSAVPYEMDGPELKHQWRESQRLADKFWTRFIHEYLPTIVRRTKWFEKVPPIAIGDIVLIIDETNPRNVYPRARVLDTIVGSNGQVRRVQVQRADKYILWRSASGLAKLDIQRKDLESLAELDQDSQTGGSVTNANNSSLPPKRIQPTRAAKLGKVRY